MQAPLIYQFIEIRVNLLLGPQMSVSDFKLTICVHLGLQIESHMQNSRQFGDSHEWAQQQLQMLVEAVPEWASVEQPTERQPQSMLRINRKLGGNDMRRKVELYIATAQSQASDEVTSALAMQSPYPAAMPAL